MRGRRTPTPGAQGSSRAETSGPAQGFPDTSRTRPTTTAGPARHPLGTLGALALLVKRDLRRRPGQVATLAVLTLLAATLVSTSLVLITDYTSHIDRVARESNAPSATAVTPAGPGAQAMVDGLRTDPHVTGVEAVPTLVAQASLPMGENDMSTLLTVVDLDSPIAMGRPQRADRLTTDLADGIWLPQFFQASGRYGLGDPITITTAVGERTFHVQGFLAGLYGSGGAPGLERTTLGLDHEAFASLQDPGFTPGTIIQVRATTPAQGAQALEEAATQVRATEQGSDFTLLEVMNLDLARQAMRTSTAIVVGILVTLAGIVLVVAAIVTHFVVRDLVNADLPSIGILRAAGHTGTGILSSLVVSHVVTVTLAAAVGVGASHPLLHRLGRSFQAQNGVAWQPGFSPGTALMTVAALVGFVVIVCLVAARRLRRLSTVEALRQGTPTHSFTRTRLPLETTGGPLPVLLGLKATHRRLRHHLMAATTVMVIVFAAVSGQGMVHGFLGDRERAVEILAGHIADVGVQVAPDADGDEILSQVTATEGVEQAYYSTIVPRTVNGVAIGFTVTPDPEHVPTDPLVTGRVPRHDNEIVLSWRLAEELEVEQGDTVVFDLGHGEVEYLVTGLVSTGRFLGMNATVRTDGFQRLDPGFTDASIVADLAPGTDRTEVVESLRTRLGTTAEAVRDWRGNVESEIASNLSTVPVIAAAITVLTVVMTVLVIGLVVGAALRKARRSMGVCRALGFTSGQLMRQTLWEHMPVISVGAVLGALLGTVALNPLLGLVLRSLGVVLVDLPVAPGRAALIALGVLALAWTTTTAACLGIRGVGTTELMQE